MPGLLDHSPADIIAQLLEDFGYTSVFVGSSPDLPDEMITVFDTAQVDTGRNMTDGERWEKYGIMIRVRSTTQYAAGRLAREIAVRLDKEVYDEVVNMEFLTGTDTSQYLVHAVQRVSGPISLGHEVPSSRRFVYTINVLAGIDQQH